MLYCINPFWNIWNDFSVLTNTALGPTINLLFVSNICIIQNMCIQKHTSGLRWVHRRTKWNYIGWLSNINMTPSTDKIWNSFQITTGRQIVFSKFLVFWWVPCLGSQSYLTLWDPSSVHSTPDIYAIWN